MQKKNPTTFVNNNNINDRQRRSIFTSDLKIVVGVQSMFWPREGDYKIKKREQ